VSVARILIVEDTEAIRAAVRSALRDNGYEVLARPDGRELEGDLGQFRPDLVVLDIMLPGRDGFQLLEVIRRASNARTSRGADMTETRSAPATTESVREFADRARIWLAENMPLIDPADPPDAAVAAPFLRKACRPPGEAWRATPGPEH